MARFLLFSLTLLVLTLAIFSFGLELLGQEATPEHLFARGSLGDPAAVPFLLGSWLLESVALTALYLLIEEGARGSLFAGLMTGWIAWVFRGPLLVLTVAGATRQAPLGWWDLAFRWLAVYTFCGLLLAFVSSRLRREPAAPSPRAPVVEIELPPPGPYHPPEVLPEEPEPNVSPPAD